MMRRTSTLSSAIAVTAGLLVALDSSTALAYKQMTYNGRQLAWPESALPVSWHLSTVGSEDIHDGSDLAEVLRGFQSWQDADCSNFAVSDPRDLHPHNHRFGQDRQNQVFWMESNWSFGQYVLGVTQPMFDPQSGDLYEADIAFNGQHYTWSTRGGGYRTDVYSIAAHEQGHFLGLDHSCGERHGDCSTNAQRQAIMFASYDGRAKSSLGSDDIEGVCAIYPANFRNECEGCGSGWKCESNLTCSSGPGGDVCRRSCESDANCPGSRCVPSTNGHGGLCACPGDLRGLDALCESSVQCRADLTCVRFDEASVCRTACTLGGPPCPQAEECRALQGGTACVPVENGGSSGNGSGGDGSGGNGSGGGGSRDGRNDNPCGCASSPGSGLEWALGMLTLGALVRRLPSRISGNR